MNNTPAYYATKACCCEVQEGTELLRGHRRSRSELVGGTSTSVVAHFVAIGLCVNVRNFSGGYKKNSKCLFSSTSCSKPTNVLAKYDEMTRNAPPSTTLGCTGWTDRNNSGVSSFTTD